MQRQALEVQYVEWRYLVQRTKVMLDRWNQNLVTRKQLRELTDDQLTDIGIDRYTANLEADKPFWRD